jgi:hypothetical protein
MFSHARDLVRATSIKAGYQAAPPQEYPLQISAINFLNSSWLQSCLRPPVFQARQVPPKSQVPPGPQSICGCTKKTAVQVSQGRKSCNAKFIDQ